MRSANRCITQPVAGGDGDICVESQMSNIDANIAAKLGALANPATPDTSPRGIKRSHSGDTYGDVQEGDNLGDEGMFIDDPFCCASGLVPVTIAPHLNLVAMCYSCAFPSSITFSNQFQVTPNHESEDAR